MFQCYPIDMTGPRSHTFFIQPGVGGLSIGLYSIPLLRRQARLGRAFYTIQEMTQAHRGNGATLV